MTTEPLYTREKTYMLSNIFLKFSEFTTLYAEEQPFSNEFEATASAVLTEFLSTEEIVDMPPVTPILDIIYLKLPAILESTAPNTGIITPRNTLW